MTRKNNAIRRAKQRIKYAQKKTGNQYKLPDFDKMTVPQINKLGIKNLTFMAQHLQKPEFYKLKDGTQIDYTLYEDLRKEQARVNKLIGSKRYTKVPQTRASFENALYRLYSIRNKIDYLNLYATSISIMDDNIVRNLDILINLAETEEIKKDLEKLKGEYLYKANTMSRIYDIYKALKSELSEAQLALILFDSDPPAAADLEGTDFVEKLKFQLRGYKRRGVENKKAIVIVDTDQRRELADKLRGV